MDDLPAEVLQVIARQLPYTDVVALCASNAMLWRIIAHDEQFWREYYREHYSMYPVADPRRRIMEIELSVNDTALDCIFKYELDRQLPGIPVATLTTWCMEGNKFMARQLYKAASNLCMLQYILDTLSPILIRTSFNSFMNNRPLICVPVKETVDYLYAHMTADTLPPRIKHWWMLWHDDLEMFQSLPVNARLEWAATSLQVDAVRIQ